MTQLTIAEIGIRQDAEGRYCLNDLHRAAVEAGANARTKEPAKFFASTQTAELVSELTDTQILGIAPVAQIKGGLRQGTFVCKELVYAYAMWISPAFHLKVIRAYDAMVTAPRSEPTMLDYARALVAAEEQKNILVAENNLLTEQRDHAIATKAQINGKKTATSMATASNLKQKCNKLEAENLRLRQALLLGAADHVAKGNKMLDDAGFGGSIRLVIGEQGSLF